MWTMSGGKAASKSSTDLDVTYSDGKDFLCGSESLRSIASIRKAKSSSGEHGRRVSRNRSEKQRRDRLNCHIAELASCLPLVVSANRKLDKACILRLAVNFLRLKHDFNHTSSNFLGHYEPMSKKETLSALLEESHNGFVLIVREKEYQITYASAAITDKLGHFLVDIVGQDVSHITHPADVDIFKRQFHRQSGGSQHSFYVRMKNNREARNLEYGTVHFQSTLKSTPGVRNPYQQGPVSDTLYLICLGQLVVEETIRELQTVPATADNQFHSYHSPDGKIIYLDQRAAIHTGFLPYEMTSMSAYQFVIPEDMSMVAWSHYYVLRDRLPFTVFRSRSKLDQLMYIKATSHIVIDMWTKKPRYILSVNTVLNEKEGNEELEKHKATHHALISKEDPAIVQEICALIQSALTSGKQKSLSVDGPSDFDNTPVWDMENGPEVKGDVVSGDCRQEPIHEGVAKYGPAIIGQEPQQKGILLEGNHIYDIKDSTLCTSHLALTNPVLTAQILGRNIGTNNDINTEMKAVKGRNMKHKEEDFEDVSNVDSLSIHVSNSGLGDDPVLPGNDTCNSVISACYVGHATPDMTEQPEL